MATTAAITVTRATLSVGMLKQLIITVRRPAMLIATMETA